MKILWLCNTLISEVAAEHGLFLAKPESWIKSIYEEIQQDSSIQIVYLFPDKEELEFKEKNTVFLSYPQKKPYKLELCQIEFFKKILIKYNPDIIHLFGTENIHSYAMVLACNDTGHTDRIVASIQGLVSVYARHFYAHLPIKEILHPTFRDLCKKNTYYDQKKELEIRGKYEIKTIKSIKYVIGRTEWDENCAKLINDKIQYFKCNESLRKSFYESEKWDESTCIKHSIFVSQSNYPIKGFHLILEAIPVLLKKYPDVHLYTTGNSPIKQNFLWKIKQSSYNHYISGMLKKLGIVNNVTFLGFLDETKMCQQFAKSHVFISPSSIENSPNSVGEAMLLGVPVITSDVGGVKDMLAHGVDGYIYQSDAPYMISYYVGKIFENSETTKQMSKNAIEHATKTHDCIKNYTRLMEIYKKISDRGNNE